MTIEMDILSIIIGVLSLFVGLYPFFYKRINAFLQIRFQSQFDKTSYNAQTVWLLKYYSGFSKSELYKCKFYNTSYVPLLIKDKWLVFENISDKKAPLIKIERQENYQSSLTRSQEQLIKQRQENTKQKLFNGSTLTLNSIEASGIEVICEESKYFDLLGCILEYENETTKAVNSNLKTPLRNKYLKNTQSILSNVKERKYSVGAGVVICLKSRNGNYQVILHERSQKVVLARGAKSVIPTFSFEPIISIAEREYFNKNYGSNSLILFNIFKEIAEELFNYNEFEDNSNNKKREKLLYELEEIKLLSSLYKRGLLRIIHLGHGIGSLVGTQMIGFLFIIDDIKASEKLLSKVEVNWEVDTFRNEQIELVELSDSGIKLIDEYQKNNLFTTSSSFALSRSIEWLNKEKMI